MNLYIKQKVFSWGDKFTVKDEFGADRYFVEGEVFSFGRKLHVYDVSDYEVLFIKQEITFGMPRYSVYSGDRLICTIKREFTFFKPRYSIEGLNWEVEGEFWCHDYDIISNGNVVASISKEWMTWGDSYVLNVQNPMDELFALAVVLTIDCVIDSQNNS